MLTEFLYFINEILQTLFNYFNQNHKFQLQVFNETDQKRPLKIRISKKKKKLSWNKEEKNYRLK